MRWQHFEVSAQELVAWPFVLEELGVVLRIALQREDPLKVAQPKVLLFVVNNYVQVVI